MRELVALLLEEAAEARRLLARLVRLARQDREGRLRLPQRRLHVVLLLAQLLRLARRDAAAGDVARGDLRLELEDALLHAARHLRVQVARARRAELERAQQRVELRAATFDEQPRVELLLCHLGAPVGETALDDAAAGRLRRIIDRDERVLEVVGRAIQPLGQRAEQRLARLVPLVRAVHERRHRLGRALAFLGDHCVGQRDLTRLRACRRGRRGRGC